MHMKKKSERESRSVVSDSLRPQGLYSPWTSPGQNTGVGSCSLLQGNLPNPGMEPRSPALQTDSLPAESYTCTYTGSKSHANISLVSIDGDPWKLRERQPEDNLELTPGLLGFKDSP